MKKVLYKPLISGIDTLEIGYCVRSYKLSENDLNDVSFAKATAQATLYENGTGIKFQGYDFTVLRYGSGRYSYILTNDDMDLRIHKEAMSGLYFPELQVRFKSVFLWRHAWQQAVKKTDEWIRSWADIEDVKISRLDVMADLIGELPLLSPDLVEVVTRTRQKKEYAVCGRYTNGWHRTGYTFGENELICRIYDKTREIKRSNKKWFETIWECSGWKKGNPVTRVEFQCRRKVIREMNINTLDDLYRFIPDLWKYLTVEWLTIRVIGKDSHRTRWSLSEFWMIVQSSLDLFGKVNGVSRIKQLRAKSKNLENNAKGYVFNMIALASISFGKFDKEYGIKYLNYKVNQWIQDPCFEKEIEKRRYKYESMEH